MVKRKNFSFYAPEDLTEKLSIVQANNSKLQALSKSQAIYYIISELANKILGGEDSDDAIEIADEPEEDESEQIADGPEETHYSADTFELAEQV